MGRCPKHEGFSDDFFHGMAELMAVLNRSREVQQQIRTGAHLRALSERRKALQKQLSSSVQSNVDGLLAELQEEARRLNAELSEFYRQIDRFR